MDLETLFYIGLALFGIPIVISYFALSHYEKKIVHTDKDLILIDIYERMNLLSWILLTGFFAVMTFFLYRYLQTGI